MGSTQSYQRKQDNKNVIKSAMHRVQEKKTNLENINSPPTFIKGISSNINFRDTKHSANNYISENNFLELQEVQEKTIFEEENEQLMSATGVSRQGNHSQKKGMDDYKSKNLTKKQQNLVKQTQYIYGGGQNPNQQTATKDKSKVRRDTKVTNATTATRGREMSADTRDMYSHSTNKILKADPESSMEMLPNKLSKDESSNQMAKGSRKKD
jgi:hypothetical protein